MAQLPKSMVRSGLIEGAAAAAGVAAGLDGDPLCSRVPEEGADGEPPWRRSMAPELAPEFVALVGDFLLQEGSKLRALVLQGLTTLTTFGLVGSGSCGTGSRSAFPLLGIACTAEDE